MTVYFVCNMAVVRFSLFWLVALGIFAIIQSILYFINEGKWKSYLVDNLDRLSEEDRLAVKKKYRI